MAIIEVTFLQCYDVILINCIMHYLISFNVLYSLPADVFLFIYLSDYVFLVHFFPV